MTEPAPGAGSDPAQLATTARRTGAGWVLEGRGRDLSALPFYRALAHFKIAVIAEGVHARHLKGVTVGDGFAGAGASVPALVRAGRAALGRGR
ncbi:hypothetical protein [Streptomyces sp. CA2R106]|uniref:hypothetical protein n=1 Tax=Streptomyces sp. CA2R106 TaxID=3120153 RepID=UPI0030095523